MIIMFVWQPETDALCLWKMIEARITEKTKSDSIILYLPVSIRMMSTISFLIN